MTYADVDLRNARLANVLARNPKADGQFVYAVMTTGVYCQPSCAARPALADNIIFYDTPEHASAAGYRACKRCGPGSARARLAQSLQDAATYVNLHAESPLSLATLADRVGLSPAHFQRSFKATFGVTPKAYHAAARVARFKAGLRSGEDVLAATFDAGYGSTSRAYAQVDGALGMTQAAYRAGGAGEIIHYATATTIYGALLMAATDRGVCFVALDDDDATLLDQLRQEFPQAALVAAVESRPLTDWVAALDAHLSNSSPSPELPLDLRGTAFQIRVWRFLLSVKPGQVKSYAELATGIGAPKATRAVGSACGANRIAVLIPCHRALCSDGGLGGYRWGLERKRALLDAERAATKASDGVAA